MKPAAKAAQTANGNAQGASKSEKKAAAAPKPAEIDEKTENLPNKDLFRVDEVAEYFNIDKRTVRRWITHGHLEGEKISGVVNVPRRSILKCRFGVQKVIR